MFHPHSFVLVQFDFGPLRFRIQINDTRLAKHRGDCPTAHPSQETSDVDPAFGVLGGKLGSFSFILKLLLLL
jgi:hypothetical protein